MYKQKFSVSFLHFLTQQQIEEKLRLDSTDSKEGK